jgi:hypothetical protein
MAAKTPDSTTTHSLGDLKLTIATFVSSDIDDNDTWDYAPKGFVAAFWQGIGDNDYDVQITSVSDGQITFDAAANSTGLLFVLSKD